MVKHGLLSRILVIHNALISSGAHSRVSILAIPYPEPHWSALCLKMECDPSTLARS